MVACRVCVCAECPKKGPEQRSTKPTTRGFPPNLEAPRKWTVDRDVRGEERNVPPVA